LIHHEPSWILLLARREAASHLWFSPGRSLLLAIAGEIAPVQNQVPPLLEGSRYAADDPPLPPLYSRDMKSSDNNVDADGHLMFHPQAN
jgi:hypothetical protein